jgi:hypothetical protein
LKFLRFVYVPWLKSNFTPDVRIPDLKDGVEPWNFEGSYREALKEAYRKYGQIVIVEQDVYCPEVSRRVFEAAINADPCSIQVVPYFVYPRSTALSNPVFIHRVVVEHGEGKLLRAKWIEFGDRECDLYGFGLTYIPEPIFWETIKCCDAGQYDYPTLDSAFSWITFQKGLKAKIVWEALGVFHFHF